MSATRRPPTVDLALLFAGFTLWAAAFVTLYALLSLGCAWRWETVALGPVSQQRAALVGVWLAYAGAAAALAVWTRSRARRLADAGDPSTFLARASFWTNGVAFGATVLNFLPVLTLSTCL